MAADYEVTIGADLSEALSDLRELREAGSITKKEFKAATRAIERGYRDAAKESQRLRKSVRDAGEQGKQSFDVLKEGAEGFGGAAGGAVGVVEKFGKATFAANKAVGPFAAGAVAAVGALSGIALVGGFAAKALVDLGARLVTGARDAASFAMENEDLVTQDTLDRLTQMDNTLGAAGDAASIAGAAIASEFAPELEAVGRIAVKAGLLIADSFGEGSKVAAALRGLGEGIANSVVPFAGLASVLRGEVTTGADLVAMAFTETNEATASLDERVDELIGRFGEKRDEDERARNAAKASAQAEREAAEAIRERERAIKDMVAQLKAEQSATQGLYQITQQAHSDTLSTTDKINEAYDKQVEQVIDLGLAAKDAAATTAALNAIEQRRARDIEAATAAASAQQAQLMRDFDMLLTEIGEKQQRFWGDWLTNTLGSLQAVASSAAGTINAFVGLRIDALREEAAAEQEAAQARSDARRDEQTERIDALYESGRISAETHAAEMEQIEAAAKARERRNKKLSKDEQQAARKGFAVQKSAQIGLAAIDAARNAIALTPAFIPFAGPGAPAAAAAAAGVALAAQVAVIQAQEPPTFAGGGLVGDRATIGDHVPILASPSEGIVSPRGMAALGREGLDRVNQGMAPSVSVQFSLDRRVVASGVADAIGGDSAVRAQLHAMAGIGTGQVLVYGRG